MELLSFTEKDVSVMLDSNKWFARKFSISDEHIIK